MSIKDEDIKRFIEDYESRIENLERQIADIRIDILKVLRKSHEDLAHDLSIQIKRCFLSSCTDQL